MKLKTVILLITLIFTAKAYGQTEQKTPTETVRGFWTLALENSFDEATTDFTAKPFADEIFMRAEIELIRHNQAQIIAITNDETNGVIAVMSIDTKDKDGKTSTYSIQFLKEKQTQKWKIIFLFKRFTRIPLKTVFRDRLPMDAPIRDRLPTDAPVRLLINCSKCV